MVNHGPRLAIHPCLSQEIVQSITEHQYDYILWEITMQFSHPFSTLRLIYWLAVLPLLCCQVLSEIFEFVVSFSQWLQTIGKRSSNIATKSALCIKSECFILNIEIKWFSTRFVRQFMQLQSVVTEATNVLHSVKIIDIYSKTNMHFQCKQIIIHVDL